MNAIQNHDYFRFEIITFLSKISSNFINIIPTMRSLQISSTSVMKAMKNSIDLAEFFSSNCLYVVLCVKYRLATKSDSGLSFGCDFIKLSIIKIFDRTDLLDFHLQIQQVAALA